MTIYLISGLGAGEEVFSNVTFPYDTVFIPWLIPEKDELMEEYARRMSEHIDSSEDFILLGVSFGGIICQEIARFLPPKKLVLISTVNSEKEIPAYIKLFAKSGITKLAPIQLIKKNNWMSHLLFGAQNKSDKAFLDGLIDQIHPYYFKWSTTQIGKWKGDYGFSNQTRIHSKTDRIFPNPDVDLVDKWLTGGHFAVFISGKKLSAFLAEILE